jgi:ankyrin repeat protein
MKLLKFMTFFFLFMLPIFAKAEEPTREQINRAVILAEALKESDHVLVSDYFGKDESYFQVDYVDKDSEKNLLFLLIEYLKPGEYTDQDRDLDKEWQGLFKVLLSKKENVEFVSVPDGATLFTQLGRYSTSAILRSVESNLDKKTIQDHISRANKEGSTALHFATQSKNWLLISNLIRLGADVDKQDRHGIYALYLHLSNYKFCKENGQLEQWHNTFELILAKANPQLEIKLDPKKYYPMSLHFAAANDDLNVFKKIAEKSKDEFARFALGNNAYRNTLSIAIENKSETVINYLFGILDNGLTKMPRDQKLISQLQVKNHLGDNLLHLASKVEFLEPILKLAEDRYKDIVDVNEENLEEQKPIDYTFSRVRKPILIIEGLVSHPNINLGLPLTNGKDLFTNLTQYGVVNAIKIYLEKFEPKWNSIDENNNPVYLKLLSLKNYDVYIKVMEHLDKLDLNLRDSLGANITHYLVFYAGSKQFLEKILKSHPGLFSELDQNGQHTLFRAAVAGKELLYDKTEDRVDPVKVLINLGIEFKLDLEEKQKGRNLAHFAVANVNTYLFNYIYSKKPELFLSEDKDKSTALHYAAVNGAANFIHKILSIPDGDFQKQDELRKYPIHYAFESEDEESIREFLNAGVMLDILDPEGKVVMDFLLEDEDWQELVDIYLEKRPDSAFDGLLRAIEIEDFIYIDYFIEAGADLNKKIERGDFKGLYPFMVPLKLKSKKTFDFIVSGFDAEVPDEPSQRVDINFNVTDHLGRSVYTYAMMTQNIENLELLKKWKVPFHPGVKVEGVENQYISHHLLFTAAYSEWKYGDDEEIEKTHKFLEFLFSMNGIKPDVLDRNGDSWVMVALKNNNSFVFTEAIKRWPKLVDVESDDLRAIDLALKTEDEKVFIEGFKFGFHPNRKYDVNKPKTIDALKKIFDHWGYSNPSPYYELINLGLDVDVILEAVDGLFENDRLLENLEIYSESYLKECRRVHREHNQNYRLQKDDRRIYSALSDPSACVSPNLWKALSEDESFDAKNFKLR